MAEAGFIDDRNARLWRMALNSEFVDVTIVCADGNVCGHQLVLAQCSKFFQKFIRDTEKKTLRPICFCLVQYRRKVVRAVLEYLYVGKTEITADISVEFNMARAHLQFDIIE